MLCSVNFLLCNRLDAFLLDRARDVAPGPLQMPFAISMTSSMVSYLMMAAMGASTMHSSV